MRKLASIRKVNSLTPIENADMIELAHIDGWGVVVKKGEFKEGDLGVYFEVDSLLPEEPRYEFLRKGCYVAKSQNGSGFRLRTIKLRKTLSQGLFLPLTSFPELTDSIALDTVKEGDEVTDLLNVKKYEPIIPTQLAGKVRGNFPLGIPKTDQERIQNLFGKHDYEKRKGETYEVTLKLHGTSCTIYQMDNKFGVCSRNLDLEETEDNVYWIVARKYDLENKMKNFGLENLAIQGEIMGPGLLGNRENLDEYIYFVYDIWNIETQKYLTAHERYGICEWLGLQHVPVIHTNYKDVWTHTLGGLLDWAENTKSINHPHAEGIVFKNQNNTWFSFKVISNKFLLEEKD